MISCARPECLDHIVDFSDSQPRRILREYFGYYHRSRTQLGLDKECPAPRSIDPPANGKIAAIPQVGGLHHR